MPQFFREFAQHDVPRRAFRIEQRHAFIARQRFHAALLLQEKLRGRAELLDRFRGVILLLQERGVTHQAVGRLRVGTQKPAENGGGLGRVAQVEQAVELDAEIRGGPLRLVQPGVDVGEPLDSFAVRWGLFEDSLVFRDGLAELVFFDAPPSPFEMFLNVRGHGNRRAPNKGRARSIT